MYACHSQIQDGDNFSTWPPCHNLSHGIKKHDILSIALHTCNMHVGICRSSMYWGVEFSGRSGTFASEVTSYDYSIG